MNCLVLTSDFPNRHEPWRGPFHRRQFQCLAAHCGLTVVEPLAWPRIVSKPALAGLPGRPEQFLDGITAYHPVFWYAPVVGRRRLWRAGLSAARRALKTAAARDFDVVLATFAYPHGLMARELAAELGPALRGEGAGDGRARPGRRAAGAGTSRPSLSVGRRPS